MDPTELPATEGYVAPVEEQTSATELERAQIKTLRGEYDTARGFDKPARKQYAIDRRYARGSGKSEWTVDANLLGSYIDILVAYIYARDPKCRVRPTDAAVRASPRARQEFAKTLQIVIERMWKQGRLKSTMKRVVRSAYTVGIGWFKSAMIVDTQEDPLIAREVNDTQDNIARLTELREKLEDGSDERKEKDELLAEYEAQVESLQNQIEVITRKAIAIDFVRAEHLQVSLDVAEIEDYLDANWIGVEIFIKKDDAPVRLPRLTLEEVKGATNWYLSKPTDYTSEVTRFEDTSDKDATQYATEAAKDSMVDGAGSPVSFLRAVEIWDKRDNHVKTMVDGVHRWAKEPFMPRYPSSRFYPFFKVDLFQVDGERHPQSLTWRLHKLQDEYASTRSNARLTRRRSIPAVLFNATKLSPEEARKITSSEQGELIGIILSDPDADMNKMFAGKPLPKIEPGLFDTSQVIGDMEKISGVQEAQQTSQTVKKTATQAEIEQSGFTTRTTAQRDGLEDTLTDYATYCAEVSLQCYDREEVRQMAGELAVWPEDLPLEAVQTLMYIEIEAGSTGRPNTDQEREAWAQVLPLILDLVKQIRELKLIGDMPMVKALTEILRETLSRLGDRIDVERFLPDYGDELGGEIDPSTGLPMGAPAQPGAPGTPGAPGQPSGPGGGPGALPPGGQSPLPEAQGDQLDNAA